MKDPKVGWDQEMNNIFPKRLYCSDLVPRIGNRRTAVGLVLKLKWTGRCSPHARVRLEWCGRLQGFLWQSLQLSVRGITATDQSIPQSPEGKKDSFECRFRPKCKPQNKLSCISLQASIQTGMIAICMVHHFHTWWNRKLMTTGKIWT